MPSLRRPLAAAAILIPKRLLGELRTEREAQLPVETGGYLIGHRRRPHLDVTGATHQGEGDIATGYSFDRADPSHGRRAVEAWKKDGGLSTVVGDWHSHPTGRGDASGADETAWRTLARAARAPMVGIILGDAAEAVYLTTVTWAGTFAARCRLIEESEDDLVFAVRA
jgi:integrative and conjugative element protein (TIGR02256 family)